jgi:hypothetical protein
MLLASQIVLEMVGSTLSDQPMVKSSTARCQGPHAQRLSWAHNMPHTWSHQRHLIITDHLYECVCIHQCYPTSVRASRTTYRRQDRLCTHAHHTYSS